MKNNIQKQLRIEELAIKSRALGLIVTTEGMNELLESDRDALVWLLSDLVCEMHCLIVGERAND